MDWMSTPGRTREVADDAIILAVKDVDEPVATTAEVSERIELGRQGAYDRLRELHKAGIVKSKKVGGGRAWWVA